MNQATLLAGAEIERRRQAAQWFLRINEEKLIEEAIEQWLVWCEADPRNREAFDAVTRTWHRLDGLALDEAAVETPPAPPVLPAVASARAAPPRPSRAWVSACAALAALLVGTALWLGGPGWLWGDGEDAAARFATQGGNGSQTQLSDGSMLTLAARSQVQVRYGSAKRALVLERGEALFQVAHDTRRPFEVSVGGIVVRAVGTAFDIRKSAGSVSVAVSEGIVQLEVAGSRDLLPVRVAAGSRAVWSDKEVAVTIDAIDRASVAAWRTGRLEFAAEPLRRVIESTNRYAPRPIRVDDEAAGNLVFTGVVRTDSIDAWLDGLSETFPLQVTRAADGAVTVSSLPRETPPPAPVRRPRSG